MAVKNFRNDITCYANKNYAPLYLQFFITANYIFFQRAGSLYTNPQHVLIFRLLCYNFWRNNYVSSTQQ